MLQKEPAVEAAMIISGDNNGNICQYILSNTFPRMYSQDNKTNKQLLYSL